MNGQLKPGPRFRKRYLLLLVLPLLPLACLYGITGYFRLGSETTALRSCVSASVGGIEKKFAVHVGPLSTSLVRAGSHLFKVPPEPRAALDSVRAVEVGVYHLLHDLENTQRREIMVSADREMKARGWTRIVAVAGPGEALVAIYFPAKGARVVKCCVMVVENRDLVIAKVRGNPQPLLALIEKRGLPFRCSDFGLPERS